MHDNITDFILTPFDISVNDGFLYFTDEKMHLHPCKIRVLYISEVIEL